MHAWVKEYKTNMAELEITPEWISPPLLDGKEQQLVEDYVGVILKKMEEWTSNLMRDEEREFISREQPVEIEEGGAYGMQGAVIMFQMINQQIDLAADSGQGGVLARVVNEANRVMRSSQERFMRLVESELNKVLDKPDEAPPGLVEYVIALANDQIKSADYAEALGGRLEPIVSKKYATVISAKIDDAINGYLDVAKACTQTLIDLIFNDLKQVTKTFFAPSWYVDRPIGLVVETMRDYLSDYQEHLNPSIFDLLLDDIIAAFLVTYLVALRKSAKLRMNVLVNRMRDDIGDVFKLFSEFKPKDELELSFEVVELVLGLLEASKEMFVLSYWPFAQAHGPNLTFVEALLKAR
jgi:exocyst complex component 3